MARVAECRADIAFWGGPDVRRTKEAAQWRRLELRRRIKALAGAAWEENADDDTVDIGGADAATAVPSRDKERRGNVEGVPAAMAAAAIAPMPPAGMSTPDAVNVRVVDVTDVVDLVDIQFDEEMPYTPRAVRSQRTKRRRFVEIRDGQ
ncbi:hypothetical protein I4F81_003045 [Pyropia yezoensis]|uniref:Uncharacterized protein n=1 Tax=Pyropia yezoensis TaxID=2788 RepID=A0ACC3BRX5_PYRYE|nr:hypothetical protein I4F81_003045 [Neopyropia yezoensis]